MPSSAEIYLKHLWEFQRPLSANPANINRPAANVAAVVTYAAVVHTQHVIDGIVCGYDGAPAGGQLQITDGGVVVFEIPIIAGGPVHLPVNITAGENSPLVITLAAGGAGVSGRLNILKYYTYSR